jgi:hypothetical protein
VFPLIEISLIIGRENLILLEHDAPGDTKEKKICVDKLATE